MFCECALQAGIQVNQLTIALEPEVASVYCRELRTDRDIKGMKYVVVDLGGNYNHIQSKLLLICNSKNVFFSVPTFVTLMIY